MPAATSPFATDRTSSRKRAAVTSAQPPAPSGRLNTAWSGASAALRTTSSVRLPEVGGSIDEGVEYSRTGVLPARGTGGVAHVTGDRGPLCRQAGSGRVAGWRTAVPNQPHHRQQ